VEDVMAVDRVVSEAQMAKLVADRFYLYATNTRTRLEYPGLLANAEIRIQEEAKMYDTLVYFLKTWILDGHKEVRREQSPVLFPKTPWQFFKQRHFPAWLLDRFPVEYDKTYVTIAEHHHYVCPHLALEDRNKHIMFMFEGVNGKNSAVYEGPGVPRAGS
jgi:hypothetical protein